MYNLAKTIKDCQNMLIDLRIPCFPETIFRVNPRFKSRWGSCKQLKDRYLMEYLIELNPILLDGTFPVDALITTILHEMIHTCPGCLNHGATWQHYAARIREKYGYPIQTKISFWDEYNVKNEEKEDPAASARYALVCENCGKIYYRKKRSQAVKHPEAYRCSCGGMLKLQVLSNENIALPAYVGS